MKKELYKYQTAFGEALWSQQLKPRQSSGIVGKETAIVYIDIDELAQIQKTNPEITNRRALRDLVISKLAITPTVPTKEEAKANTTTIVEVFSQAMAKQEKKSGIKLNAEQVTKAINNAKITQAEREQLLAHFKPTVATPTPSESQFDF